jgi:hypothetical protein
VSLPVILFVATSGPQDISIARREPDGTLRRAEYANINWLDRLSREVDHAVSLVPDIDFRHFNERMQHELGRVWIPAHQLDLESHVSGYFTAMRRYHGSDWSDGICGVGYDIRELSEAIGVPVQSYDPDKNSTNRLNWTMRLWERTKD